ncbi:MAG: hypothetical protein J5849_05750 [Clostridia bacterium]|nr:hypothetical protein [Clostridia bacterium]
MSVTIRAVFQDVDAADLAVRDLKKEGCELLTREISRKVESFADPDRFFSPGVRIGGVPQLAYRDNGAYYSLPAPRAENRTAAGIDPGDLWSDQVTLSIRVPDGAAERAGRLLLNRGGSHVRRV